MIEITLFFPELHLSQASLTRTKVLGNKPAKLFQKRQIGILWRSRRDSHEDVF